MRCVFVSKPRPRERALTGSYSLFSLCKQHHLHFCVSVFLPLNVSIKRLFAIVPSGITSPFSSAYFSTAACDCSSRIDESFPVHPPYSLPLAASFRSLFSPRLPSGLLLWPPRSKLLSFAFLPNGKRRLQQVISLILLVAPRPPRAPLKHLA